MKDIAYVVQGYEDEACFVLDWGINGCGFGQFTFVEHEDGLYCGDEYMDKSTVLNVVRKFCANNPQDKWPSLLKKYGSPEALLAAVMHWECEENAK